LDAEIMDELINEAREAFDQNIVQELRSDNAAEVEENVERLEMWIKQWKKDHADDKSGEDKGDD
jgi:adenylate kinase